MLKFDVDKHQMRQAIVCGPLVDLIVECAGIITFLYGTIYKQSESAGQFFKASIVKLISEEKELIFDPSIAECMHEGAEIVGGGVYSGNEKIDEEELTEMLDAIGLMHLDNDEKAEIMRKVCGIGKNEDSSKTSSIGKVVNSSFDYPDVDLKEILDNEDQ